MAQGQELGRLFITLRTDNAASHPFREAPAS